MISVQARLNLEAISNLIIFVTVLRHRGISLREIIKMYLEQAHQCNRVSLSTLLRNC